MLNESHARAQTAIGPADEDRSWIGLATPVRVRFGFDTSAGAAWASGGSGPSIAFRFRAGAQFGRYVGVTVQTAAWVVADSSSALVADAVGEMFEQGMLLHYLPTDFLDIGVGPALDLTLSRSAAKDHLVPALDARLALNIGKTNPTTRRRVAFTIAACPHVAFTPTEPILIVTVGPGAEWY
jgi:hypothetical protein